MADAPAVLVLEVEPEQLRAAKSSRKSDLREGGEPEKTDEARQAGESTAARGKEASRLEGVDRRQEGNEGLADAIKHDQISQGMSA